MDCFGSVILYNKGEEGYCSRCPLQLSCAAQVAENRVLLEEALRRPVFDDEGKFWEAGRRTSLQRRAMAAEQSSAAAAKKPIVPVPAPAAPAKPKAITPPGTLLAPRDAMSIDGLPKKVHEELVKWVKNSIAPELVLEGKNPFQHTTNFKFANLYVEAWLRTPGKPSKRTLREVIASIMEEQGDKPWSLASMQSNVNIVTGAFFACGIDLVE